MKNKEYMMHMSRRLKLLRIEKGLSIKELSDKTGIPLKILEGVESFSVTDDFNVERKS